MKVTLKGGQLTVDVAITTEAEEGASSLKALLQICAKSEPTEEAPCEKDGQK